MTTNETYDLDAEILLAANPYRIPSDADLVEAERGCNQYKHKPGCTKNGKETGTPQKENLDVYYLYNNKDGKMEEVAEEEMFDFIDNGLTTATITSNENGLTIEAGEDKRTLKFGKGENERTKQREFVARAFGSFDYEIDGKPALDDDALDKILDMAKKYKSVSLAVFGDYTEAAHEPSIEDLLVGDLVEAAGCNQYKHKPGCPHAINNAADEVYKLMDEVKKYRNFGNKTELDSAIYQWDSALSKSKSALERAKTDEEKEEAKKEYLKTIKYGKMIFEDYKKYYSKKN